MIKQGLNYLHEIPLKAGFVKLHEEYKDSSANDQTGVKSNIDIELLISECFVNIVWVECNEGIIKMHESERLARKGAIEVEYLKN
jgi:hypothetical protein